MYFALETPFLLFFSQHILDQAHVTQKKLYSLEAEHGTCKAESRQLLNTSFKEDLNNTEFFNQLIQGL